MVDKTIDLQDALKDFRKFVDMSMPTLSDTPGVAVMQMAIALKNQSNDDNEDYVKGVTVGLWLAHLVIEWCEKRVN